MSKAAELLSAPKGTTHSPLFISNEGATAVKKKTAKQELSRRRFLRLARAGTSGRLLPAIKPWVS